MDTFFPDPIFAWTFCVGLVLLTGLAAWYDTRKAIIPNRLTVLILILGVVANVARGAWLASDGRAAYMWPWGFFQSPENPEVWVGVVQGVVFALTGFLFAFTIMFLFWMFGMCGGGDVKLLGAIGGWVGMAYWSFVWVGSVLFLFLWVLARILSSGFAAKKVNRSMSELKKQMTVPRAGKTAAPSKGRLRVTYSLPIAVATAAILVWVFKSELQLVQTKPQPDQQGASAHVPPPQPTA